MAGWFVGGARGTMTSFSAEGVSIQWGRDDPTMEPPRVWTGGKKNFFHKGFSGGISPAK